MGSLLSSLVVHFLGNFFCLFNLFRMLFCLNLRVCVLRKIPFLWNVGRGSGC